MNRKKEVVIFIIIIPLLLFSFLRLEDYRFSGEDVFYAYERGLGYGPSEKILGQYDLEEGGKIIVGIWEGNLSAVSVKRAFGVLWKRKSGEICGLIDCDKVVSIYLLNSGRIIGFTSNSEINEVCCKIEYGDHENPSVQEELMTVNQDGLIWGQWEYQGNEDLYQNIVYTEGRNSRGEVLYQDGMTDEGIYYNNGIAEDNEGNRE